MNGSTPGLTALWLIIRTSRVSQADLARRLGVSPQWVSAVLHGRARPSAAFRRDLPIVLAELLDISDDDVEDIRLWFFGPEPDTRTPGVLERRLAEVAS